MRATKHAGTERALYSPFSFLKPFGKNSVELRDADEKAPWHGAAAEGRPAARRAPEGCGAGAEDEEFVQHGI